jgi:hypothetical protein
MRSILRGVLSLLGSLVLNLAPPALAADDPVELRVVPQEIALQPGSGAERVILIAQASADWSIKSLQLHIVAPPGVSAETDAPLVEAGDFAWNIDVTANSEAAKDSTLLFRVDYETAPVRPGAVRSGTVGATAKISYEPLAIAQAVKITVHHGFDTLRPDQAGDMLLAIENTGIAPVTLRSVGLLTPDRSENHFVVTPTPPLPVTIPGRDIVAVPVVVTAPETITPGTATLLMDLRFDRGAGQAMAQADIAVADQVTLGIPGLSDLKTVLQIPSLLFMPGVVIVLTWALIWNRRAWVGAAADTAPKFPLSAPSPEFWVVSIMLSLIVAAAYPRFISGQFDLWDSVSVRDIGILWFGSIVIVAPLTYIVGAVATNALRRCRDAKEARRKLATNPQTGEDAVTLLPKLVKAERPLRLPAYSVAGSDGQKGIVFDLGFGEAADGKTWVAPAIRLRRKSSKTKTDAILQEALNGNDSLAVYTVLTEHPRQYDIAWKQPSPLTGPRLVDISSLGDEQGKQTFIELA